MEAAVAERDHHVSTESNNSSLEGVNDPPDKQGEGDLAEQPNEQESLRGCLDELHQSNSEEEGVDPAPDGESSNCPDGDSEKVPAAGERGEIQFRCKLCQFTGEDKDEIANHFLSEHIAVEVRTVKKGEGGSEGGLVEIARIASPGSKKRGRSRGKTSRKTGLTEQEEGDGEEDGEVEDEEDDADKVFVQNPERVTVSTRGRRRKVPFKFAVSADDDGSRTYARRRRNKAATGGKCWKLLREDESFIKRHKLNIPIEVFEEHLVRLVEDWEQTWFMMKSNEDVKCTHQGCKCQLDSKERELHMECHRPFLEGFQCPMCDFVCVHWRNMRHHYYKEHQEKGKRLRCNQPDCQAAFVRFGELKRHVTSTHLKLELLEQLNKKKDDKGTSDTTDKTGVPASVDVAKGNEDTKLDDTSVATEAGEDEAAEDTVKETAETASPMDTASAEASERECEVESTKKRITKWRRANSGKLHRIHNLEPRKKRSYTRSQEFGGNLAERQRALVAFVCDICGAKYNSVDDLEKHRTRHQGIDDEDLTLMRCTECDRKFSSCEPLVVHVKEKHVRLLKLHRCHLCQFASDRRFDLKKHLIIHTGVKSHMCDICGKCMSTPYNLKIHYLRLHARDEEKDIGCSEEDCDFKCADRAVLKDHLRQRHNLFVDTRKSGQLEKIKLFSCKHCSYIGRKESSLRYHMRIHLEDRQHKCRLCPYASKTKNNLILHMRTHEGMQPMQCPKCDFRGATNKIVSEHILKKHVGIKPYQCVVCKWSTSYSGNMWKHIHDHREELGDKMPEEPVVIVTSDKVNIPAPLRPPSGRKRKPRSPTGLKSPSPRDPSQTKGFTAARGPRLIQVNDTYAGENSETTVTILEVPISEAEMIVEGSESSTTSALNSLAVAVATAREMALLSQQAKAAVDGGQTTDTSNPFPVTNLFQQIAGQASSSTPQSLAALASTKKILIAVTQGSNLGGSVLTSTSSQPGDTQTAVTYAQSQPQPERLQFTIGHDGSLVGQTQVGYVRVPAEGSEGGGILVNVVNSDLEMGSESAGNPLQGTEEDVHQKTQASEADYQEIVTMTENGELVMNMVERAPPGTAAQSILDHQYQQPLVTDMAAADSENPSQDNQPEDPYVQSGGDQSLGDTSSQVVQIIQQENGQLVYQDSTGQMFSAENSQAGLLSGEMLPLKIPEAIAVADAILGNVGLVVGPTDQTANQDGEQSHAASSDETREVGNAEDGSGNAEDLSLGMQTGSTVGGDASSMDVSSGEQVSELTDTATAGGRKQDIGEEGENLRGEDEQVETGHIESQAIDTVNEGQVKELQEKDDCSAEKETTTSDDVNAEDDGALQIAEEVKDLQQPVK